MGLANIFDEGVVRCTSSCLRRLYSLQSIIATALKVTCLCRTDAAVVSTLTRFREAELLIVNRKVRRMVIVLVSVSVITKRDAFLRRRDAVVVTVPRHVCIVPASCTGDQRPETRDQRPATVFQSQGHCHCITCFLYTVHRLLCYVVTYIQ